jgi:hypothetical protein
MRRYPEVIGPAVLLLFCLAPHGVFRAARITPRAVSSYLAFSPLPISFVAAACVSGVSKNRRSLLCDTFRHRSFSTAAPACSTRHAAVWYSDFPLANLAAHQRSPAISDEISTGLRSWKSESSADCANLLRILVRLRSRARFVTHIAGAIQRPLHVIVIRRLPTRRRS